MKRRLEDRIEELCAKLIRAEDGSAQFSTHIVELQAALKEHTNRFRAKMGDHTFSPERRSAD
jgi:hypothetical protein